MGRKQVLRPLTAPAVALLLSVGCYSSTGLRLEVQSRSMGANCVRATDRVFADAGFERVRTVTGPDMFYTPRTRPGAPIALGWGIGAWLKHDAPGTCGMAIQALSADPAPGPERSFTVQPGEPFDATVRDMATRLDLAFASPAPLP